MGVLYILTYVNICVYTCEYFGRDVSSNTFRVSMVFQIMSGNLRE